MDMDAFEFALTCAFIVSMITFVILQIIEGKKEEAERLRNQAMSEHYRKLSLIRYTRRLDERYKQAHEEQMRTEKLAEQDREISAKAKAIPKQKKNTLPKI